MRIVYLSKEYPPYGLNSASALFYPKLATAFAQMGHEVHVICQAPEGKEESPMEEGKGFMFTRSVRLRKGVLLSSS